MYFRFKRDQLASESLKHSLKNAQKDDSLLSEGNSKNIKFANERDWSLIEETDSNDDPNEDVNNLSGMLSKMLNDRK